MSFNLINLKPGESKEKERKRERERRKGGDTNSSIRNAGEPLFIPRTCIKRIIKKYYEQLCTHKFILKGENY